jgi:hypothetical protein
MNHSRREMLQLMTAAAIASVGPISSRAVDRFAEFPTQVAEGAPPIKARMFWTWDHSTEWALNRPGAHTMGAANEYGRSTQAFVDDYTALFHWCSHHNVNAVVLWGLLRDSHGGLDSAKRLADIAAGQGVQLLCGVGLNCYGGVYYEGDSPISLEHHLDSHPELIALDRTGNKMNKPHQYVACPSRVENQEFAAESLRWLFTNLPLGGVQIETGDYTVCHCHLCKDRRKYAFSTFSWEDMALMYPIAARAIRSVSPKAWIVCETYSHPEPYSDPKAAPGFGEGKPYWADECLDQFPKGDGIFAQWVCDQYVPPLSQRTWTSAGRVSSVQRQNIMRSHFGTYWAGHLRGELSIDWIAEMVKRSAASGFSAISLFGEVSPFNTGAELNYLALENYGSTANPNSDVELFLDNVAAPLLGGPKSAQDFLRYARLPGAGSNANARNGGAHLGTVPAEILREIYARCGSSPPDVARRWVWLANYLASADYPALPA